jgi:hypothetical protein
MRIVMCVCAIVCMYHATALTKLTAKESTQSTEKAILSDLYLRKAAAKYPHPSGSELTCSTHHHRNDPQPSRSADGHYVPWWVYRAEMYLIGDGLWKRYDGNRGKPWRHAKINENWKAKGLVEMARDGRTPDDGIKYRVMNNHYRNQLVNAINSVKHECSNVGNCRHDNYISIPVGESDDTVFSPGLNQMWIILDAGRHDVLCHVVVGSQADDSSVAYYIGAQDGNGFNTVMSFDFTTFSDKENPMMFKLGVSTGNGLASLIMDIKHSGGSKWIWKNVWQWTGGNKYIHVKWACRYGGIGGWKPRSDVWMWGYKHYHKEFALFLDKGTQIFDICHCYVTGGGNLVNCTTADDGSGLWHEVLGVLIQDIHRVALMSTRLWHIVPRVTYSWGPINTCWQRENDYR